MTVISRYTLGILLVLGLAGCNPGTNENHTVPDTATASAGQSSGDELSDPESDARVRVLFLGDSITAGYGLDPESAFPALLQRRADSLGLAVDMVNAGLSGETSAGGLRRIGWLLRRPADILVLELGGNDGLRGIPVADTRRNLLGIVDSLRVRSPGARIIVAGMMIPPNMGAEYTRAFRDVYPDVAAATGSVLIPFVLEGVGGVQHLMQEDGIHPTAEGHVVVAETVWQYLEPLLRPAG